MEHRVHSVIVARRGPWEMLTTVAVVIDVAGGASSLLAQHHGVRLLSFLRFSGRFGRLLAWSILLGNSTTAADATDHLGFPPANYIGNPEKTLEKDQREL
jgi:hypothetical protein